MISLNERNSEENQDFLSSHFKPNARPLNLITVTMKEKAKQLFRRLFYRSALARLLIGALSVFSGRTRSLRVLHLLSYVDARASGPLQRPEALLLNALAQVLLPRVVVEFGFFKGHSAFNFLQALGPDTQVFSYDIADHAAATAADAFLKFPNFHFIHKSQTEFAKEDLADEKVDLVFFDAVHSFPSNQETWRKIYPSLSDRCLVVVHDTGTWERAQVLAVHAENLLSPQGWLSAEEYQHQREEREFVNWLVKEYPQYTAIHLHTLRTLRHGLSILQRSQPLPTTGRGLLTLPNRTPNPNLTSLVS